MMAKNCNENFKLPYHIKIKNYSLIVCDNI